MTKPKFKFNWKSAAGEIIYIFLGITLAIWFQNWNDARKEQAVINTFTYALNKENGANLEALPKTMEQTAHILTSINVLMGMMGEDYQKHDPALVDSLLYQFLFTPTFNANQEVIQEIIESGKLEAMKVGSLRRNIVKWNLIKQQTEQIETIARKQMSEQIVPFLRERISILAIDQKFTDFKPPLPPSAFKVDNRKILADFQFENLLEIQFYALNYQQQYHQQLLDQMNLLDETLKRKEK